MSEYLGSGPPLPHGKTQSCRLSWNYLITGWKNTKLPMSVHHRTASEAPFIWRFAGGPMVARFGYFLCPCKFSAMNTVNNVSNSSLEVVIKPTMSNP